MPGAGKTTLGAALARRLGCPFADSDREMERRAGQPVSELFGSPHFRADEAAVIDELTRGPSLVLATGGGAVLCAESRARLRSRCRVVYLSAAPEELWRRLHSDRSRPLLQVADPLGALRQLHHERAPLYQACAHVVVQAGGLAPEAVLDAVCDALARPIASQPASAAHARIAPA